MLETLLSKLIDPWSFFLASVKVTSYIPGRIRCYSDLIRNNEKNCQLLASSFKGFQEIKEFKINPVTGSVLIIYAVEELAKNPYLKKMEEQLKNKYLKER